MRVGCLILFWRMGEGAWGGGLHRRIPIEGPAPGGGAGLLIWVGFVLVRGVCVVKRAGVWDNSLYLKLCYLFYG